MSRTRPGPRVHLSGWYRLAALILRRPMILLTKHEWHGIEHLSVDGSLDPGIVAAPNHLSWFDPIVISHFLYDNGRPPRFLAKEPVFRIPVAGRIITGAGQIPVYRETRDATAAVSAAIAAVRAGECVVVYPEGTITRDPDLWPMTAKTGAVRIALATGCPLIPIAHWGAQEVMGPYRKEFRILPRKTMRVAAGPPVDLSDLAGKQSDVAALAEGTRRLIAAITDLEAGLRGEVPPAQPFDYAAHRAALRQDAAS